MRELKIVGMIEGFHGHKGTVKVKPVDETEGDILNLKEVYVLDEENEVTTESIYETRKYRRGRVLIKFSGLKWRGDITALKNRALAVAV